MKHIITNENVMINGMRYWYDATIFTGGSHPDSVDEWENDYGEQIELTEVIEQGILDDARAKDAGLPTIATLAVSLADHVKQPAEQIEYALSFMAPELGISRAYRAYKKICGVQS